MQEPELTKKATLLVVDDMPDNLALMNGLLKDEYHVKVATGGETALAIAGSDSPPDLILLDIMMPGIDGYEVCRRLKLDSRTMKIPVIFLTAKHEVEDETRGLELGAVDYITRPVSPPIVMARVKTHLALKAMADFLQKKNVELDHARLVAEKANLAKSEFLSSMSHELRSPLNAILGFAQLMEAESPAPTPSQKASIDQILGAGWHLLTLINEILDLTKIESGQVPMSKEPVSLDEIMRECQGMTEPQAQQNGIRMTFPRFDMPCFVNADRTRLKQVLINLLSNAIKYNVKDGTVEVTCSESAPGRVRVSIRDSGEGLLPEQLTQLFQPFNRLGQESGNKEGTGIGLVVAKRLVELMGGTIGVESTLGVGSVFWFELIACAGPQLSIKADDHVVSIHPQALRGVRLHTLLYIEDNPANVALVEKILARQPDTCLLTATSGSQGIQIARDNQPDVILMDINLPGMSGFEALKILRSDPATAHIPVIAISANAMPMNKERGLRAGFFRYMTKPIVVNEFIETLELALELAERTLPCARKELRLP